MSKEAAKMRRELGTVEAKLKDLAEIQLAYVKRMLKFGGASLVFGLSTFFSTIIISDIAMLSGVPPVSISLLILAAAALVLITTALVYRFTFKIKRLEGARRKLLVEYEMALLKHVGEINKN